MKTKVILVFITIAMATGIFANVRAPYNRDGFYSGHPSTGSQSQVIILEGENLSLNFPQIIIDKFAPYGNGALTEIQATYFINNKSSKIVSLPVEFLGVNIHNFLVKLNDKSLENKITKNRSQSVDFFKKLVVQRLKWNNSFHQQFINFLKYWVREKTGTPIAQQTTQDILKILEDEELIKRIFLRYSADLTIVGFKLDLKPGKNFLKIVYKQRMNYREGGTRYGSFIVEGAVFSFDYLLYPALSWKAAPDFKLKIEVSLPDVKEERTFKDRYYALQWESNVNFNPSYNSQLKKVSLSGEFNAFPEEILTFVLKKGTRR